MLELIDTHQHFVVRAVAGTAWTAGVPALAGRDFTLAEYRRLTEGLGIGATLFMETGVDDPDDRAETRFVAALAREPASGIGGLVASCRPEDDTGFDAWIAIGRRWGRSASAASCTRPPTTFRRRRPSAPTSGRSAPRA